MAFKELKDYYVGRKKALEQVISMFEAFDKDHKEGVLEDEIFNTVKNNVETIRDRYETIAYFFMLWGKPTPEEKEELEAWEKEHKESFDYLSKRIPDKIIKEEEKLIQDIENYVRSKENV